MFNLVLVALGEHPIYVSGQLGLVDPGSPLRVDGQQMRSKVGTGSHCPIEGHSRRRRAAEK